MDSTVTWKQGMAFDAHVEGLDFVIDAAVEHGGDDLGPRPKPLVLTALAGCTAMDVIAMLTKMKVTLTGFSVRADTTLTADHPKVFDGVVLRYDFAGDDLPEKKLRRAVELSTTRYCGVNAMLSKATEVRAELWVNGTQLPEAPPA